MKKQFSLEIQNPCSAKFSEMTPNVNGSFCSSCAKNVIDLSHKTNSEVAKFLATSKESSICARLRTSQLEEVFEHNETSKLKNLKYATAIAASVLLTSNVVAQEKETPKIEIDSTQPKPQRVVIGKVLYREPIHKVISITIQGKLLVSQTKKPISEKLYPNLTIYMNGASKSMKIDAKTGRFEVPVLLNENATEINVSISNDDRTYSNTFKIDLKLMKNNKLDLNIYINPDKELQNYKIMGGLGIKTINQKSNNS